MMTVISSQRFRDEDIINEKLNEIESAEYVEIPVISAYLQDDEGNDLYIIVDKHHTLSAARELGKKVRFVEEGVSEDSWDEEVYKIVNEHCWGYIYSLYWHFLINQDKSYPEYICQLLSVYERLKKVPIWHKLPNEDGSELIDATNEEVDKYMGTWISPERKKEIKEITKRILEEDDD